MKRREFLINSAITVAGLSLLMGTGEAKEVAGKKGIKKMKKSITLNYENIMPFINGNDIDNIIPKVKEAKKILVEKSGAGKDYLGWLDLPENLSQDLINDIEATGKRIRETSDILISIGIGGSYLGARAAISAVNGTYSNELSLLNSKGLAICYSGCDMSTSHLRSLLDLIKNKRVFVNVISKSGTTTEPAIALRVIYEALKDAVGEAEANKRIIATTDCKKGALKTLADSKGWKRFIVPDDVGGRYSVLTPVGLLPISATGMDIKAMLQGAKDAKEDAKEDDIKKNIACLYVALRNILYKKGKKVEIMSTFEDGLHYFGEWWKQLYGESEGKENRGIYPDSLDFSTDLHSMGQYIQEGERMLMETFIDVETGKDEIKVPHAETNDDGLGYLEGKTLRYVNRTALKGTAEAHKDGGVPNMTFVVPEIDEYYLGYLFYMFEYACGVSGYMGNVNPFNQPGVEAYKKNMFRLLGKPGSK